MLSLSFFAIFGLSLLQGYKCEMCMDGYQYNNTTQQCEDIDECTVNNASPCLGNLLRPICENTNGSFMCRCRPAPLPRKYGKYCNTTDPAAELYCMDNPDGCNNNGVCENFEKCNCKKGYHGQLCEYMETESCSPMCWNNGTCLTMFNDSNAMPKCFCAPGYSGEMCQYKLDLCAQSVCLNGGTCMTGMDPLCQCTAEFTGKYCETHATLNITCQECKDNITLPNYMCTNETHTSCPCPVGFYGSFCQYTMRSCDNGGVDVPVPFLYSKCICPEGLSGPNCVNDTMNECNMTDCQNGGTCRDMPGYFQCDCAGGWRGRTCDIMDTGSYNMTTVKPNTCALPAFCPAGQEPWRDCSNYMTCQMQFLDGMCAPECNNEKCLYDGLECLNSTSYCMYSNCSNLFDNNQCDAHCNSPECGHDGGDCMDNMMVNILGTVVLDITFRNMSDRSDNMSAKTSFLAMTLPYRLSSNSMVQLTIRRHGSMKDDTPIISEKVDNSTMTMFYRAYYKMANSVYCNMTNTCWSSVERFAGYLAAFESINTNRSDYQITRVSTCMEGYYGDGCMQRCSQNCNKTMSMYPVCEMETGACTNGCKNKSFAGPMCDVMCSPNCLSTESCYDNGTCKMTAMGTCKTGYSGPKCDMVCQDGNYGIDCMESCDRMCTATCNKMTGQCMCNNGYSFQDNMASCNKCMDTYYGPKCMNRCNANCNNRMCNNVNGSCQQPCSVGYVGDKCDQACQKGNYGMNCSKTCDRKCKNSECNHITGNCNSCENDGLKPPECLVSKTTSTSASKQDYSSTVIAVIVVLVILVVVALVVAFVLWKRSQEGKYDTNEIEERGLVLKDVNNHRAKPNEYVSPTEARFTTETPNGVDKSPLIGEGQPFDTIDLATPPADSNTSMPLGGVFDGNANGAIDDPFAKKENGVTSNVTAEVEEPKVENDLKTDDIAAAPDDKPAEENKEGMPKDVPYIDNTSQEKLDAVGESTEEKSEPPMSTSPDTSPSEEVNHKTTNNEVDTTDVEKDTNVENNVTDPDVDSKDDNKSDEEKT